MASGSVKKKTLGITPSTDILTYGGTRTIADLNFSGRIVINADSYDNDYNSTQYYFSGTGTRVLTYFGGEAGSSKTGYGKNIKLNYLNMDANSGENYVGLRSEFTITSNLDTGYTLYYFVDGSTIPAELIDTEE